MTETPIQQPKTKEARTKDASAAWEAEAARQVKRGLLAKLFLEPPEDHQNSQS